MVIVESDLAYVIAYHLNSIPIQSGLHFFDGGACFDANRDIWFAGICAFFSESRRKRDMAQKQTAYISVGRLFLLLNFGVPNRIVQGSLEAIPASLRYAAGPFARDANVQPNGSAFTAEPSRLPRQTSRRTFCQSGKTSKSQNSRPNKSRHGRAHSRPNRHASAPSWAQRTPTVKRRKTTTPSVRANRQPTESSQFSKRF